MAHGPGRPYAEIKIEMKQSYTVRGLAAGANGRHRVLPFRRASSSERLSIPCVYLSDSPQGAKVLAWLAAPRGIGIHRASSLPEASELLGVLQARVLLADASFAGGTWADAQSMLQREHPEVALIVFLARFDGHAWVEALERGSYDVLVSPYDPTDLRNTIVGAHRYALRRLPAAGRSCG